MNSDPQSLKQSLLVVAELVYEMETFLSSPHPTPNEFAWSEFLGCLPKEEYIRSSPQKSLACTPGCVCSPRASAKELASVGWLVWEGRRGGVGSGQEKDLPDSK